MIEDGERFPNDIEALGGEILGCARVVYHELGPGLLESSYQRAMEIVLTEQGIPHVSKLRIEATFRGKPLGVVCEPDLLVGGRIVVELKAQEHHESHEAQVLTYMQHTKTPLGFLLNFHAPTLSAGIRRKVRSEFL